MSRALLSAETGLVPVSGAEGGVSASAEEHPPFLACVLSRGCCSPGEPSTSATAACCAVARLSVRGRVTRRPAPAERASGRLEAPFLTVHPFTPFPLRAALGHARRARTRALGFHRIAVMAHSCVGCSGTRMVEDGAQGPRPWKSVHIAATGAGLIRYRGETRFAGRR